MTSSRGYSLIVLFDRFRYITAGLERMICYTEDGPVAANGMTTSDGSERLNIRFADVAHTAVCISVCILS